MSDYQNGRIYKIIDLETNECYIGSTTLALSQRLAQHVSSYKRYLKGKGNNITSFKIIANGDYDIVLIELFPCDSKDQLHARESHYTQTIQCLNRIKNQGLFIKLGQKQYKKQYDVDHKDQSKLYREQHIDHIKHRKNTVLICQCGSSYTRSNVTQHIRSEKHTEYVINRLYYDIRRGLNMIQKLDDYFFKNKL
jgi:hypothetical protein